MCVCVYIYMYIYISVCVCTFICVYSTRSPKALTLRPPNTLADAPQLISRAQPQGTGESQDLRFRDPEKHISVVH